MDPLRKDQHNLVIVNSSTDKSFSVCLQCANDISEPVDKCYQTVGPSSNVSIPGSSPTGNLFISVDGKQKWSGLIPTDNVVTFSPETGILTDGSGKIPPVSIDLPFRNKVYTSDNKSEPPKSSKYSQWWWIGVLLILIICVVVFFYFIKNRSSNTINFQVPYR